MIVARRSLRWNNGDMVAGTLGNGLTSTLDQQVHGRLLNPLQRGLTLSPCLGIRIGLVCE